VACQMAPAIFDTVAVDMLAGDAPEAHVAAHGDSNRTVVRANGSTLVKRDTYRVSGRHGPMPCWMILTTCCLPCRQATASSSPAWCPPSISPSLRRASPSIARQGAGRIWNRPPSTYASIFPPFGPAVRRYREQALHRHGYRKIVSRFLTQYFTTYVDYDFTAKMEDSLDAVATGEQEWVPLLDKFWRPFIDLVNHTETSVSREEVAQARDLGKDPVSGKPMSVRMGRFGPFVQIGTKDDEISRVLRPAAGQKMDAITHEQAMELFKLPRKLGTTAAGEEITTNVGRFAPT